MGGRAVVFPVNTTWGGARALVGPLSLAAAACETAHTVEAHGALPPVVLWAWERPEDLRFIDPEGTGIAFLAGTVRLAGERVVVTPRAQPLAYPVSSRVLVVVRIESSGEDPPLLSRRQREEVVAAVVRLSKGRPLQLDFDAKRSERAFYSELFAGLRRRLPERFVSITALASWCLDDPWIETLPIDEAIPMLFRMGVGDRETRRRLAEGGDFRLAVCRHGVGLATDESPPSVPEGRRLYLFHPRAWSAPAYRAASKHLEVSP